MGSFFDFDSDIMNRLRKVTDLIIVNLLTILCCIPVVTVGAALTAAHYTLIKMHRDSENYIIKNYFRSFVQNFKQATILWLIYMAIVELGVIGFHIFDIGTSGGLLLSIVLLIAELVCFFVYLWVLPLQARFSNTISGTIKNAMILSFKYIGRTFCMGILSSLVLLGFYFISAIWSVALILVGVSLSIYLCVLIYDKVFLKLEK